MMVGAAIAETPDETLHPALGKRPPREVLNRDILNLTQAEGSAWVHGAVAQMAQTLAAYDPKASKCVMFYFFEERDGLSAAVEWMQRYPERPTTVTLAAVATRVCPKD